jgi:hypothetical protein
VRRRLLPALKLLSHYSSPARMCSTSLSALPSYRVLGRRRLVSSRRLSHRTLPSKRPALQPLQRNATVMHHMQALAAERQPSLPDGCFPDGLPPAEEGLSGNAPWDVLKDKHSLACESCINLEAQIKLQKIQAAPNLSPLQPAKPDHLKVNR